MSDRRVWALDILIIGAWTLIISFRQRGRLRRWGRQHALIPQHAAEQPGAPDQQQQIAQPDCIRGKRAALGAVHAHNQQRIIDQQDRQEAEEEAGQEVGVAQPNRQRDADHHEEQATEAVTVLKEKNIFSHAMFVVGDRKDTAESIAQLREFANELDPDFAIFTALTPFHGTEIYEEAKRNGWIEDFNLSHYDMAHAIMPTETLSRMEVQEELYNCYRSFYGSWRRRLGGLFSSNKLKSRLYRHMMEQGVIRQFKNLIQLPI